MAISTVLGLGYANEWAVGPEQCSRLAPPRRCLVLSHSPPKTPIPGKAVQTRVNGETGLLCERRTGRLISAERDGYISPRQTTG